MEYLPGNDEEFWTICVYTAGLTGNKLQFGALKVNIVHMLHNMLTLKQRGVFMNIEHTAKCGSYNDLKTRNGNLVLG